MIYRNFALVYDDLMNNAPYDKWTSFTLETIAKHPTNIRTMIDLGCGTGEITMRMAEQGYSLYGIDMSNDMLAIAMEKSTGKQLPIQWIQQDIRKLSGFKEIDMAISFCDVINYLSTEEEILTSFKNVFNSLRDGGLFLFDIHAEHYAKQKLMNHSFTSRDDDVSFIWDCENGERNEELIHYLSFFIQIDDGVYERFDEIHNQYVFPVKTYKDLLKKAQFTILNIHQDFSREIQFSPERAERIFILAEKKAQ